jgi:hypothetical protein
MAATDSIEKRLALAAGQPAEKQRRPALFRQLFKQLAAGA